MSKVINNIRPWMVPIFVISDLVFNEDDMTTDTALALEILMKSGEADFPGNFRFVECDYEEK